MIVLTILGLLLVIWFLRSRTAHRRGRKEFLETLSGIVDQRMPVEEWERFLHSPIVNSPRLEAARGRLIRLDDKYERGDREPISDRQREEMRTIHRELELEL